jgi:peroxiredoxin
MRRIFTHALWLSITLTFLNACSTANLAPPDQSAASVSDAATLDVEREQAVISTAVTPTPISAASFPMSTATSIPVRAPTSIATMQAVPPEETLRTSRQAVAEESQVSPHVEQPGPATPDVSLRSFKGEEVRLSDFRGQPIVLTFFSTTCAPCAEELAVLQQLQTKYRDELVILLVGVFENSDTVDEYAQQLGLEDMPILLDEAGKATMEYRVTTVPTSVFIDREGQIATTEVGAGGRLRLESGLATIGVGQVPDFGSSTELDSTEVPAPGCGVGGC